MLHEQQEGQSPFLLDINVPYVDKGTSGCNCCNQSHLCTGWGMRVMIASLPLTTMSSLEHNLSLSSQGSPMAHTPSQKPKGGSKPKWASLRDIELLMFDILSIFHCCWFLFRANLVANAISAQKVENGNISWVEFSPPHHSHLVKCTVVLVPHPVHVVKRVIFVYILELPNGEGHMAIFKLQKGGCKANNAQKEKRHLYGSGAMAAKQLCETTSDYPR